MIAFNNFAPVPPVDMVVDGTVAEWAFLWANVAMCVGLLIWSCVLARSWRSALPLMCVIGGSLTIFLEPLIDAQLQVWWPHHQQPDVLSGWGRHLPLMVLFVVTWYFGAGVLLRLHWLKRSASRNWLWTVYAIEVGAALALEPTAISMNLWHYYGEQGVRFFGYPIWWPFVGGACNMLGGTVLYRMMPKLVGWKVLVAAPLVPMCVAAVYWSAGWPMFYALNVEPPSAFIYLVSAFSVALAFVIVWLCTIATGQSAFATPLEIRGCGLE